MKSIFVFKFLLLFSIYSPANWVILDSSKESSQYYPGSIVNTGSGELLTSFAYTNINWFGSMLRKSSDRESTWTTVSYFPANGLGEVNDAEKLVQSSKGILYSIVAVKTEFDSAFSALVRTSLDHGKTWESIHTFYFPQRDTENVDIFLDEKDKIYAAASGNSFVMLSTSDDQGKTWVTETVSDIKPNSPFDKISIVVHPQSGQLIICIGGGNIYRRNESDWELVHSRINERNREIFLTKENDLITFGSYKNQNLEVFKSKDSGQTWSALSTIKIDYGHFSSFFEDNQGNYWLAANIVPALIYKSQDRGKSWNLVFKGDEIFLDHQIHYLGQFTSDSNNSLYLTASGSLVEDSTFDARAYVLKFDP